MDAHTKRASVQSCALSPALKLPLLCGKGGIGEMDINCRFCGGIMDNAIGMPPAYTKGYFCTNQCAGFLEIIDEPYTEEILWRWSMTERKLREE